MVRRVPGVTSERALHWLVADTCALFLPADIAWTTIRNEGLRGWREQADIKRKRMRAGWPDMHFVGRHRGTGKLVALYLELKRPGEKPDQEQKDIMAWLDKAGAVAQWATSLERVLEILDAAFGLDLRGRLCAADAPRMPPSSPLAAPRPLAPAGVTRTAPDRMTSEQYQEIVRKHLGKAKGGQARSASLSPERRVEIARKAANARWGRRS